MLLNSSNSLALASKCPDFSLVSVDNQYYERDDLIEGKKGLVVAFWCNHCPYVKAVEERFLALSREFLKKNIQFVTICSNDSAFYPIDAPAELHKHWLEKNFSFPYLVDDTQKVARRFDAQCTPDIFVFDQELRLYYHGQIDDNWKDAHVVKKHDLNDALTALLDGQNRPAIQKPTIGCSIKWKNP